MTADSPNGGGYMPASDHIPVNERKRYWAVAIGLQAVDGLEVSPYLRSLAQDYEAGERTLVDTGELIRRYHGGPSDDTEESSREADLVSQRIAELLAASPFALEPEFIPYIHGYLFQDIPEFNPGSFKTERMMKPEAILNGDTVRYAEPSVYDMSLSAAMRREKRREYGLGLTGAALSGFCQTVSFIWQVHPFYEGNTRTVAVFSELYLDHLGYSVGNDPFAEHSAYYRDALVRSIYRNPKAAIEADSSYLVAFYDNAVNDAGHSLDRSDLICAQLFDHPELVRNIDVGETLTARHPTGMAGGRGFAGELIGHARESSAAGARKPGSSLPPDSRTTRNTGR